MSYSKSVSEHAGLQKWMMYNPSAWVTYKLVSAPRQVNMEFCYKKEFHLCSMQSTK